MESFTNFLYNTKIKCYPDGTRVATYSNQYSFNMLGSCKLKKIKLIDFSKWDIFDFYALFDKWGGPVLQIRLDNYIKPVPDVVYEPKKKRKRSDNLKRTQDKIYDIVMCNEWSYFFTGTLGDTSFDPKDAKEALQPLQNWLKNQVKRKGLKYILVAEYQPKSGRIHFHGFINDALEMVDSGTRKFKEFKKPLKIETALQKGLDLSRGHVIYNMPSWSFGWSTAIKTYNGSVGCAQYIMKYITKDCKEIFGRYYWSSRNIERDVPVTMYEDNEFSSIKCRSYSIPGTTQQYKYYTFFPEQVHFHWETEFTQAENNSNKILSFLQEYDDVNKSYERGCK